MRFLTYDLDALWAGKASIFVVGWVFSGSHKGPSRAEKECIVKNGA